MLGRVTGEASNLAFYAHDTKIVHHTFLIHLQRSLTQLTALKDIISLDKFITDVASAAQNPSWKQGDGQCVRCSQSRPQSWLGQCTQLSESGSCHECVGRLNQPAAECFS